MAFKQVLDLDAENAISLGGNDKKTRKANPTSIEGYYLGTKVTESKFGPSRLHILQTDKGNLGVWGKTDMDRKLGAVIPGTMVRVTYTGEVPSNKGNPMKKFKVEVDDSNRIDVEALNYNDSETEEGAEPDGYEAEEEQEPEAEEEPADEITPQRPSASRQAASAPSAARQKQVQDLLRGRKSA